MRRQRLPRALQRDLNATFASELGGRTLTAAALPEGQRIVPRIDAWLKKENVSTRATPSFSYYRVAAHLAAHPSRSFASETLANFEKAFAAVNALFAQ